MRRCLAGWLALLLMMAVSSGLAVTYSVDPATGLYVDENGDLYVHVDDPANAETYFHMSAIDRSGYEAMSDVKPLPGVDYVELGSVDASLDAGYESYDSEDVETVTTVTGD